MLDVELEAIVERSWDDDAVTFIAYRPEQGVDRARYPRRDKDIIGCDGVNRLKVLIDEVGDGGTKTSRPLGSRTIGQVARRIDFELTGSGLGPPVQESENHFVRKHKPTWFCMNWAISSCSILFSASRRLMLFSGPLAKLVRISRFRTIGTHVALRFSGDHRLAICFDLGPQISR